jgi:hypothetical protein
MRTLQTAFSFRIGPGRAAETLSKTIPRSSIQAGIRVLTTLNRAQQRGEPLGIPALLAISLRRTVDSVAARSADRVHRPARFVRGSFRII